MTHINRLVKPLTILFVCALSLILLAGCSSSSAKSDEDQINDVLNTEFNAPLNASGSIFADETASQEILTTLGITEKDFTDAMLNDYSYTIDSVNIDGQNATASVTVTMKDFAAVLASVQAKGDEMANNLANAESVDYSQLSIDVGKMLIDSMKDPNVATKATAVNVQLAKANGTWSISNMEDVEKQLSDNISAGLDM